MICAGFLSSVDRADLTALARDGSAAHRLARRANALVLLDSGWSCEKVAAALLLDDDTIRRWHGLFIEDLRAHPANRAGYQTLSCRLDNFRSRA
jgi:GrpB-like predicted nucleotidyltransferase (UPF0157 family)